jgi:hypothetical protein
LREAVHVFCVDANDRHSQNGVVVPFRLYATLVETELRALIVGGIQPEHTAENSGGFIKSCEAPEAEAVAVQATQEGRRYIAQKLNIAEPAPVTGGFDEP